MTAARRPPTADRRPPTAARPGGMTSPVGPTKGWVTGTLAGRGQMANRTQAANQARGGQQDPGGRERFRTRPGPTMWRAVQGLDVSRTIAGPAAAERLPSDTVLFRPLGGGLDGQRVDTANRRR
jgi:hypothetical protein